MDYPAQRPDAPLLLLAHGAGAGETHPWLRHVARGLADRGVSVATFNFPYMAAGRSVPDRGVVLEDAFAAAWRDTLSALPGRRPAAFFAGGKSMGGRIASQVAARGGLEPPPDGLVLFGYPLHPPGKPGERRDRHLPQVRPPMLFLHGTRDPFGTPEELERLTASLLGATLHLVRGGDHSLNALKRDDPERRSLDTALDVAAAWMTRGRTDIIP